MRKMKNSGVAWIGDVPENWETIPNKYLMRKVKAICQKYSNEDVLSLTMNGVIKRDLDNPSGKMPSTFDGYQFVYAGNLLMCLFDIDVTPRCIGLIENDGITSPAYSQFELKRNAFNRYYYYYYLYLDNKKELLHLAKNLRHSFTEEQFGQISTVVPPIEQQHLIANQLDFVCKKVEDLISNQEQQIEKLKQYKQSLITEVVTKGLNPDVPMKDSGVKWLGKIPNNWQTKKIKYVAKIIDDKYLKGEYNYIALENIESHSARFIKTDSVYDLVGTKMAYSDTVIFGKLRPYLAKVFLVKEITCVNNEFSVFKGLEVTNEYLKYFMLGSRFIDTVNASTYGTKMPRANIGFISNLQITIPPFQEQQNIANYLDDKCAKIDRLIAIKQEKIDKLNNYKKSLIYEYVTGKREVC